MRKSGASSSKKSRLDKVKAELKQARDDVEAQRKKIMKEARAEVQFKKGIKPKMNKIIEREQLERKYPYTAEDTKALGWSKDYHRTLNKVQKYKYAQVVENGKIVGYVKRLKYGESDVDTDADKIRCHDCGANVGEFHAMSCDWERDPVEGGQMLTSDNIGDFVSSIPVGAKEFQQHR